MSSPIQRMNTVSKGYTGNTTLPENKHRGYLFIIMNGTAGTVELGEGGGLIPLTSTGYYEPHVAPIGQIDIVCAGNFVVVEG